MDFKEYCREKQHSPYCSRAEAFTLGQQSKQAEIDALQQQNQRLAMRLDVVQGALQKQIDLIVELKK